MGVFLIFTRNLILAIACILLSNSAHAQEKHAPNFKIWEQQLQAIETLIQGDEVSDAENKNLRDTVDQIIEEATNVRNNFSTQRKRVQDLVATLKPKSEKSKSIESTELKERRTKLEAELANIVGQQRQAELILTRSQQVLTQLTKSSRAKLKKTLLERGTSPISYGVWKSAIEDLTQLLSTLFKRDFQESWLQITEDIEKRNALIRSILIALVLSIISFPAGKKLRARFGRVHDIDDPTYSRRLFAGIVEGIGKVLAPVVFVLSAGFQIVDANIVTGSTVVVVEGMTRSLALLFFGYALINAAFTPRRPQWRIIDFGSVATDIIVPRLQRVLFAFVVLNGTGISFSSANYSVETVSTAAILFTFVLTPLLFFLLDKPIWERQLETERLEDGLSAKNYPRLRGLLAFVFAAIPILAILGYSRLSIFILNAIVISSLVIGGMALLRAIFREAVAVFFDKNWTIGRIIRAELEITDATSQTITFWLKVLIDVILIVATATLVSPVWGIGVETSLTSATAILKGINIGSYTFSLLDLIISIALFILFIVATRYVQRLLDQHVLPNLTKDRGVRDALKTGVGYLGYVLAGLVGISALGLDLSNLALIAGALSVGLGFGLQNVVSNFVSGLILLAERPIKQGDWVVVGAHEGKVKNVSVRATEVETFQRASVIIPNADLISNPVTNWTHKNVFGRVDIAVGVSYDSEPEKVKEILLECAKGHPNVSTWPETYVLFMDFGQSSLNFELRAYLNNVENRLITASELRFAIFDALKENDIEIPFPQRVIHMADKEE